MWCPLCGQVGSFTVVRHALSAMCILVSAFKEPQRTQAGRPIFSLLLGLLTTQEKGFQTGEACHFNMFNCLWPFRSPICSLSSKHGKIMATADVLVKGPQWPCRFGFSWVIWPASFREMRICFLHFGCVVAGFQEQLMCHVGWRHTMAGSARTSWSYDITSLNGVQIWGIPLCPPPTPSTLCL